MLSKLRALRPRLNLPLELNIEADGPLSKALDAINGQVHEEAAG